MPKRTQVDGGEAETTSKTTPAGSVSPRNKLNALTAKEWISESVSVWVQRGLGARHAEARIERLHPAPFSYTDVSRLVRPFSKPGDTVLEGQERAVELEHLGDVQQVAERRAHHIRVGWPTTSSRCARASST